MIKKENLGFKPGELRELDTYVSKQFSDALQMLKNPREPGEMTNFWIRF